MTATSRPHRLVLAAAELELLGRRAGPVVWFGLPGGRVDAKPTPGPDGERLVRLTPADRADLPVWVAPLIGGVLR